MTRRRGLGASVALAALTWVACGHDGASTAPPPPVRESLREGVVAEVGDEVIASETVGRIAALRGIDRRAALDAAVGDAAFAAAARRDLDAERVASAERRALAHALLRQLWLESKREPISDAELKEATEVRWTHYDRPRGYRTVHVVARLGSEPTEQEVQRAEEHAERLREALLGVAERARQEPAPKLDEEAMFRHTAEHPDPVVAAWEEAVNGVDHGDVNVLAQPLPPVTSDGRPINHDTTLDPTRYDEEFTRRVTALTERGQLTDVFRSFAGYHVAMLLEITPPRHVDRAGRLQGLRDEILRVRALRARRALLGELRDGTEIERPLNVDALLSLVRIELDEG